MGKKTSYGEVTCRLQMLKSLDSEYLVAEGCEEGALERLSEKICQHTQSRTELDRDDTSLDEIGDPEVTDVYVAGLLCCRPSSLDQLDRALVILVYHQWRDVQALGYEECPGPEALLQSLGQGYQLCLARRRYAVRTGFRGLRMGFVKV